MATADILIGIVFLLLFSLFISDTLLLAHWLGSVIHIDFLKQEVEWLMGLPAGFKPNENLDNIIGQSILLTIYYWNYVTTFLTGFEP